MAGFVRHRRSKQIIATFSAFEADLLRSLAAQLIELLHNEAAVPARDDDPLAALLDFSGPTTEPDDPVLQRLLPNAYRGDAEAAGEFRRFTENGLRDSKSRAAVTVIETLEEAGLPDEPEGPEAEAITLDVELDQAQAQVWMRSLTDLRLALATRLGVVEGDEDYWAGLPDEDPRAQAHHIFEWLGFLQETLVHAVSGRR
ncbi:DUF2017 domain-containing protein [Nocardioides sp. GY 10113]|uniref:DUF2017 domain-containing protein n=1 Tax=Nocardioides sp. GY 10113 TaxID=2569761 RepID=UPI0010A7D553|nr:DUF2017 domain-containing protein [Nocardioides sp. GY 10113]TIC87488.1 DUF2017 domain-containing protein [Nocardioides sp. GY 10113]